MKFYLIDPYSRCQSCGHRRSRLTSKEFCPSCGQEIKTKPTTGLISCQKCKKPLDRLLIGEKVTDRHVFQLMAYPELNLTSLSGWKRFWIGKVVINEDGEHVNKGWLVALMRHWPRTKDPITGKLIKAGLMIWDSNGNEIPLSKKGKPWIMVYEIAQPQIRKE